MIRKLSCIVCPMSCTGEVTIENGQVTAISGFTCQRGIEYATEEVTAPKRMLTTTVRIQNGKLPLLPVVSAQPIPKEKIKEAVRYLANVIVQAPVAVGDVICADILGLGVAVVASRDLTAK